MYMCLDTMKLYFDQGISPNDRVLYDYISVRTINDLQYNIQPEIGLVYYCWEDNSLWLWNSKWVCLFSRTTYPSGYTYDDIPSKSVPANISPVYRYDMPNMPADDNGLLKDGSVVIRDANRLIKGKLYVDEGNNNLVISSFLGGGIRLLPNGKMTTEGEFYIDSIVDEDNENYTVAGLRAQLNILNNELYVDYSENEMLDDNQFQNDTHKYKVFHEGNLDTSAIVVMTPLQVYKKLTDDKSTLPEVFDFNVSEFDGHDIDDFSMVGHKHTYTDITDLPDKLSAECTSQLRRIFNSMSSTGITSSYNAATQHLTLKANDFTLSLTGGVSGIATIEGLSNTSLEVTVNPDMHTHQDLLDEIDRLQSICDDLQEQINELKG